MKTYLKIISVLLLTLAVSQATDAAAQDGVLKIEPGMYKITGKTKTNLDEKPHLKSSEVCIPESEIRPETMLPSDGTCNIKNLKSSEKKASFDIECEDAAAGSTMKGSAEYSTNLNTFNFKYELRGKSAGKEITVHSEGKGERTGECP